MKLKSEDIDDKYEIDFYIEQARKKKLEEERLSREIRGPSGEGGVVRKLPGLPPPAMVAVLRHGRKVEKKARKLFPKADKQPKIFIVTDKLLTGFDAPVLYCMYLDKPMRDHVLLRREPLP